MLFARLLRCSMAAAASQDGAAAWSLAMFTYVLTFVACLGTAGDRCRHVELPWDGSLMQCMLFGQQAAASWTSEHPGYALVRGWRCESGRAA
jgi:hypothetical protein